MGKGRVRRLFVADDHPLLRQAVHQLVADEDGLEVCGEAADYDAALEGIERSRPDVAILDVTLPGGDGLELLKQVSQRFPDVSSLMFSAHDEAIYAERSLRAGARGYLMKTSESRELLRAIESVLAGRVYLSAAMVDRALERMSKGTARKPQTSCDALSDRELQVLRLLGEGYSTSKIAKTLCLSVKTIETYRAHLKRKLGLRDSSELLRYAVTWVERP